MPELKHWTADDLPDLSGKTILITGANSGIGYEAALQLARMHADVVLGCRRPDSARAAADQIVKQFPGSTVEVLALDLSSRASIRAAADEFRSTHRKLDVLCNNAGVMALPYSKTFDGFEMQFGTNHLGHFALTGLLLEPLLAADGARVVTVSSGAHKIGAIRFDNLNWDKGYNRWRAYGQSKLANLLFMRELQRKAENAGAKLTSIGCHPGYAATNLQFGAARMRGSSFAEQFWNLMNSMFSQTAAMGALPTLYAAVAPEVEGGDYIGPDGFQEMWGYPAKVPMSAAARDTAVAAQLWDVSEKLTDVHYEALSQAR
ncbi:MAG TPA: oxidoreductase [Candidatus Binataceae bacterium]|nr:oxidoreductase [Candidatus Binataceae bacterium]